MSEWKRPRRRRGLWIALIGLGGVGVVAAGLAVVFAVMYTNGISGRNDVAPGNAQPKSNVLINDSCANDEGLFEPQIIQLACGDGTAVANGLTWSEWNASTAVGRGTVNEVTCVPDCADGRDVAYPVNVSLSEPVKAQDGKTYFTRITVTYTGPAPNGAHTETYKECSDTPPAPYVPACPADERGAT